MHLLAATSGAIADGSEAVDLGQDPGDIVFLTAADTEIASLADAWRTVGADADGATLRLANLMHLSHNMSVDLYVDRVVGQARLVIVRLLGGRGYWPFGVERITMICEEKGIPLAWLPGDDQPDAELAVLSTLPAPAIHRLWQYLVQGGAANAAGFLGYALALLRDGATGATGGDSGAEEKGDWIEPAPLLRAGLWWPDLAGPGLDDLRARWTDGAPLAALVFYRALVQAGNTVAVAALVDGLAAAGLNPLPVYVASLRDPVAAAMLESLFADAPPDVIVNTTGFAVSRPGAPGTRTPFTASDCPVLQAVFAGGDEAGWRDGSHGLSARDIAMNVALPEVDGRILARAVSFKGLVRRDEAVQADIVGYVPVPDRVEFTANLAAAWAVLRRKPVAERRVAVVLANYPNRDGRLGNGVGLDTPAGSMVLLRAMAAAGYDLRDLPADGAALVARLAAGPTNLSGAGGGRAVSETLSTADYAAFFATLPGAVQTAVTARWGRPEEDPFWMPGELDCGSFAIPAFRCGKVVVGLQPARGYNIDPQKSYHDPDLVPPHGYLAFHAWLRDGFRADAVIHMGKHGNLEWLPGKSLALSDTCFPEVALGPMPHLYPFIVNDPGEGSQAKRRAQAVIIDHLTPPLARAESYGPLRELERLVDEYYEAAGVDPRRIAVLRGEILDLVRLTGIDIDCGIRKDDSEGEALARLDAWLCELKEMQIRDGLHIFGRSPEGGQRAALLVALARVARGRGEGGDASITRALAADLDLDLDPLDCDMAQAWTGPRPALLADLMPDEPWRSLGDTVERLEALALVLVEGLAGGDGDGPAAGLARTADVLATLRDVMAPAVDACGAREIAGILAGLDGRFVEPGPSGAPTRGRPEVLPTGRNFYSVDTRMVPTPAAWTLGWKSATLLVERHAQEHGNWPRRMAISAWGTSNMRTGGDDIAQALALMGVRPEWDTASGRVCGFEIMPASVLGRPRVDVTLRISGFFRDAFPGLIDLFDSAVRAVAALDEPPADNPLAARAREETALLEAEGRTPEDAERAATWRIFGSKPGAYGAGLQALIDERGWRDDADLARAWLAWGGYAYGSGGGGAPARDRLEARLSAVEAVVHNQDNREHDLLDSDDYYQFEGGMTATVRHLSGRQPAVWHNDHSRPESPRIRTLEEEVARVVRARVVNPKWIRGVMRHGYKGAFEMAATVDYLFAFAATARVVRDHHFDAVFEAYIRDDEVRGFIGEHNPAALGEMAARLLEAQERGLWRPKANLAYKMLSELGGGNGAGTGE